MNLPRITLKDSTNKHLLPNLGAPEHIQAYKHGLRSFSLTKVLAPKRMHNIDDLFDIVHEFIKGERSVNKESGSNRTKKHLSRKA